MPTNFTQTAALNRSLRRGFVIALVAAAALYSQAPAQASPKGETAHPPDVRPPAVRPPVVLPPRTGIEGARKNRRDEKGCSLPKCRDRVAELEKEFLGSKDGKDAKKKIAKLKEIQDKKLAEAEAEYRAKQKAKQAKQDDDYACCTYTAKEIADAQKVRTKKSGAAVREFEKAKEKIVSDGLKKSNPEKSKEYIKAQADLKAAKKAEPKVTKIGDDKPTPGGDMPWDPPEESKGPRGPVGGPVEP